MKYFQKNPSCDHVKLEPQCTLFLEKLIKDGYLETDCLLSENSSDPKLQKIEKSLSIVNESNMDDIFFKVFDGKLPLLKFQIEITNNCNESCVHCYLPKADRGKIISDELFYSTLEELKAMNVLKLSISGGEPFLHPHIKKYLTKLSEYDFFVGLLSNLTLLDDDIISLLLNINTVKVQTSLYSMNDAVHDSITCMEGSFSRTKGNIEKLIKKGIHVKVSCPVMKKNRNDFLDVYKWCQENGIDFSMDYALSTDIKHLRTNEKIRLSAIETKTVFLKIIENNEKYQKSLYTTGSIISRQRKCDDEVCNAGKYSLNMIYDGTLYPCAAWQTYYIGNILQQPLKNIWSTSDNLKRLRKIRIKDISKGECAKCANVGKCSICMAKNANESDTANPFERSVYFCKLTHSLAEAEKEWQKRNTRH